MPSEYGSVVAPINRNAPNKMVEAVTLANQDPTLRSPISVSYSNSIEPTSIFNPCLV